jgi:hypothetical protein
MDQIKIDEPLSYARVSDMKQLLLFEADKNPKDT